MGQLLKRFEIEFEQRIVSAHKTPKELLKILKDYEKKRGKLVYITIAGRSNALSGVVDANTKYPVIACPPVQKNLRVWIFIRRSACRAVWLLL